jgi:methylated-DNA-[protein]-cysteine S-methyltransferase
MTPNPANDMNMIRFTEMKSPIGILRLTGTERGLTGLYMNQHRHAPEETEQRGWTRDDALFAKPLSQLNAYFAGRATAFDITIDREAMGGTSFQRQVWSELERIPYGVTISYGELAQRIGNPKAVRAVGLANGRNPISIIVPCHRVIGANGTLTGYGGGLERKRWLLELERGSRLFD